MFCDFFLGKSCSNCFKIVIIVRCKNSYFYKVFLKIMVFVFLGIKWLILKVFGKSFWIFLICFGFIVKIIFKFILKILYIFLDGILLYFWSNLKIGSIG